jgi:lipid-A-disaccharide synthase
MTYRIFISTGEVSGDLQGSLLARALLRQAALQHLDLKLAGLGGERMAAAGVELIGSTVGIGSVGLWESLPYVIPTIQLQNRTARYLSQAAPDLVVLIDYMGPNIGIGNRLRRLSPKLPIVYYIAPQEWVFSLGEGNTTQLIRFSNRILAVFPEEAKFYEQRGAQVTWVGHPLLDTVAQRPSREICRTSLGIRPDERAIALLPASRVQELRYLMPVMFAAARQIQDQVPNVRFWIPLSMERYRPMIEQAITEYGLRAELVAGKTEALLGAVDLALTKSGTANLELALRDVPMVVLYRVSPVTAWIAQYLLKFSIPFMSPVNLVNMESIVPELLQHEATPERIVAEALPLLTDDAKRQTLLAGYERMRHSMGEVGVCDRAAQEILEMLTH